MIMELTNLVEIDLSRLDDDTTIIDVPNKMCKILTTLYDSNNLKSDSRLECYFFVPGPRRGDEGTGDHTAEKGNSPAENMCVV